MKLRALNHAKVTQGLFYKWEGVKIWRLSH